MKAKIGPPIRESQYYCIRFIVGVIITVNLIFAHFIILKRCMDNLASVLFVWPLEFKIIIISVSVDVFFLVKLFAFQSKIIVESSSLMRNITSGTFHLLLAYSPNDQYQQSPHNNSLDSQNNSLYSIYFSSARH